MKNTLCSVGFVSDTWSFEPFWWPIKRLLSATHVKLSNKTTQYENAMWQGRIWPPTTFSILYWLLRKTCSVTSAPQSWHSEMRYSSAVWHGFALPVRLTAPMPYSANSAVVVKMFRWLRQVSKPSSFLFRNLNYSRGKCSYYVKN